MSPTNSAKILASHFANLPSHVRMKVAEKLLRWIDENQETGEAEKHYISSSRRKSLLEQFWDEVEASRGTRDVVNTSST